MFSIKAKYKKTKTNEFETDGKVAYIKLPKKDGTTINTIIDAEDLAKVLENGSWFAGWHKDFNNYIAQTINEESVAGKKQMVKQTLQSFLIGVHTKAPIRHLNGNTLDNRRCNLELYKQDTVNDYVEFNKNTIAIILRDKYGKENAKTLIDKEDLERVMGTGFCWVCHKVNKKTFAVANTPGGRIFLNRFIIQTPDDQITHAINLNTLDNRKSNLENVVIEEEDPPVDSHENSK